ncbi:MAG: glycosyltransferase [Actinobacteria bacterium]|nr:glycosyltransferase [Actinomycetota bacterium]
MKDLSIIIVNYNGSGFIESCLESIIKHLGGHGTGRTGTGNGRVDFEVIIMDNASTDGSTANLRSFCSENKEFRLIEVGSNTGFGMASNKGAGSAEGRFLLFLNPDCRISNGDMGPLLKFYEDSESPGIIGVRITGESGSLQYSCRAFPTLARQFYESYFLSRIFSRSRLFGSYFMSWWDHLSPGEVDWLSGSFMLVERRLFMDLQGFSPDYFMYSEDTDLCLRFYRNGRKNYYYTDYCVEHTDSGIASRDMTARESEIWKSRRLYFWKNYSPVHAAVLSLLYFTGIINRMIVFGIASLFSVNIRKQGRLSRYSGALKKYFCTRQAGGNNR